MSSNAFIPILFGFAISLSPAAERIAVIKADDVRSVNPKWERFFKISHERGVSVTAGVIANSIPKNGKAYAKWMKKWDATGKVEFWNHGWDHKRWDDNGTARSEFGNSGYDHQSDHLMKAQEAFKEAVGRDFTTFGSPFNAMDMDTAKALNEIPELEIVFCYPGAAPTKAMKGKTFLPMNLRGEHDGTGKPDFEKFKVDYAKKDNPKLTFAAIQFHPPYFSEKGFKDYEAILDFLKSEGWIFMLPSEYAQTLK